MRSAKQRPAPTNADALILEYEYSLSSSLTPTAPSLRFELNPQYLPLEIREIAAARSEQTSPDTLSVTRPVNTATVRSRFLTH